MSGSGKENDNVLDRRDSFFINEREIARMLEENKDDIEARIEKSKKTENPPTPPDVKSKDFAYGKDDPLHSRSSSSEKKDEKEKEKK